MRILRELAHFPDFVKLSHTVFAMPFALASLLLASHGRPGWGIFLWVMAAMVTARTTGMAFNRIVDRKFDAENPRTAVRHLPSGAISLATAWLITLVSASLFVWVAFQINALAGWLSPVALLVVCGYSWTKRFTSFSHFFLGLALGLAPLGAWVAVQNGLGNVVPWMLAGAVILWVAGFDIIYSLQDLEFDRRRGLHSFTVRWGQARSLRVVYFLHVGMLVILFFVGWILGLPKWYYLGWGLVGVSLAWEQGLIRKLNEGNLQLAFLQANAAASFSYLGAVILGIYLK